VETFHLATLTHDDVVDAGDVRRGLPSLPACFGGPIAGAAGGFLFGRALKLFSQCGQEAVETSAEAAKRICDGQMLEMQDLYDVQRSPKRYLAAAEGKTAPLFWLAARLGGIFGDVSAAALERLERYGVAFGTAHQIIDDIIDLIGDEALAGKTVGNDLRNGIYTLPVIYALDEQPELRELLTVADAHEIVADEVAESGGIGRARDLASRYIDQAKAAVAPLAYAHGLVDLADEELARLGSPA
jgi:heptaprenyl diphosphate synthase